jgi:hypothetical protein
MWYLIDDVIKINSLNPKVARKLATDQSYKYNMIDGKISTLNCESFIKDVVETSKTLSEGFGVGDLKLVLEPYLEIDMYKSKIGKDDEICVINFLVNDKQAAIDLVDFIEKGYNFCIDADISSTEFKPGSYFVFVELLRRLRIIPQIFKIISDLSAASELNLNKWKFRYVTSDEQYPLTKEELKKHVPLSPKAYKETVVTPIEEILKLSGVPIKESFSKDETLQSLQHAAGIDSLKNK